MVTVFKQVLSLDAAIFWTNPLRYSLSSSGCIIVFLYRSSWVILGCALSR
ncbi:unnamed protein product [Moneuplotes crassus]|uniref:Uncharacterized protein n=1 Tax=Euplotes crassus TaxID=5936 RepID=A0AAD2D3Y2_EUPCR|nr:unnamed protein product [Moneuplotes crassus]